MDLVFSVPPEPEMPSKVGMEYFMRLWERLVNMHELTRDALAKARLKQREAYDAHAHSQDFVQGEHVCVYCSNHKKGLLPKLMAH